MWHIVQGNILLFKLSFSIIVGRCVCIIEKIWNKVNIKVISKRLIFRKTCILLFPSLWLFPLTLISFRFFFFFCHPILSSFSSEGYLVGIFQTNAKFKNDLVKTLTLGNFSTRHSSKNHPSCESFPLSQKIGKTSLWDLLWKFSH